MARGLLLLLVLLPGCASWAAEVAGEVVHNGDMLRVEASAEFEGSVEHAWQVLTDYDHLSDFVPGMQESRAVGCGARGPVVVQKGDARFLFLSYAIEVRLAIEEYPMTKSSRALSRATSSR